MVRYHLFLIRLILLVLVLSPLPALADSEVIVFGEVKKADGQPPGVTTVRLMEITMSEKPTINPVQSVQTDSQGAYQFKVLLVEDSTTKVFYRIAVDADGYNVGSNPFRLEKGAQPVRVDLTIPAVTYGIEHLEFPMEILIIENLLERIRVTTILYLINPTGGLVNAKKIPFTRKLPESAINFQSLGSQRDIQFSFNRGELTIGMALTAGTHEIAYSYEIQAGGGDLVFNYYPIPGMREVEFTTPDEMTEIIPDQIVLESGTLSTRQKKAGGRLFRSKVVTLEKEILSFPITIRGIPMNQSSLFVPAVALLVILLVGLAWFLARRPAGLTR